ncbi:unnamed protein product [Amoebophrya sp. A120]|nr:unnamed protein product [Amoebophrya sp. A120]|eukprot:GSA120T00025711001.1
MDGNAAKETATRDAASSTSPSVRDRVKHFERVSPRKGKEQEQAADSPGRGKNRVTSPTPSSSAKAGNKVALVTSPPSASKAVLPPIPSILGVKDIAPPCRPSASASSVSRSRDSSGAGVSRPRDILRNNNEFHEHDITITRPREGKHQDAGPETRGTNILSSDGVVMFAPANMDMTDGASASTASGASEDKKEAIRGPTHAASRVSGEIFPRCDDVENGANKTDVKNIGNYGEGPTPSSSAKAGKKVALVTPPSASEAVPPVPSILGVKDIALPHRRSPSASSVSLSRDSRDSIDRQHHQQESAIPCSRPETRGNILSASSTSCSSSDVVDMSLPADKNMTAGASASTASGARETPAASKVSGEIFTRSDANRSSSLSVKLPASAHAHDEMKLAKNVNDVENANGAKTDVSNIGNYGEGHNSGSTSTARWRSSGTDAVAEADSTSTWRRSTTWHATAAGSPEVCVDPRGSLTATDLGDPGRHGARGRRGTESWRHTAAPFLSGLFEKSSSKSSASGTLPAAKLFPAEKSKADAEDAGSSGSAGAAPAAVRTGFRPYSQKAWNTTGEVVGKHFVRDTIRGFGTEDELRGVPEHPHTSPGNVKRSDRSSQGSWTAFGRKTNEGKDFEARVLLEQTTELLVDAVRQTKSLQSVITGGHPPGGGAVTVPEFCEFALGWDEGTPVAAAGSFVFRICAGRVVARLAHGDTGSSDSSVIVPCGHLARREVAQGRAVRAVTLGVAGDGRWLVVGWQGERPNRRRNRKNPVLAARKVKMMVK